MSIRTLSFFYAFGLYIIAATHTAWPSSQNVLYKHYVELALQLKSDSLYSLDALKKIYSALTPQKQKSLLNHGRKTKAYLTQIATQFISFPLWIRQEFNHYETIQGNQGCLVVNGYDTQLKPMTITVDYVYSTKWLIEDFTVNYLQPGDIFSNTSICQLEQSCQPARSCQSHGV